MKLLVKKLKNVLKNNTSIIDLLIFGSVVKNKLETHDVDIALLTNGHINRTELKKQLETSLNKGIDLQIITLKDYDKFIWVTLIKEGYSIRHEAYLHELYRIKPIVVYTYSLKPLSLSKKVMFERALKNFKNIERLSNRVIFVPIEISGEFSDFLQRWDIDIEAREYGLLPLVRKERE